MIPSTLSATSVGIAENCLSRWGAEMLDKSARVSNDAARLGSSVHGGLEAYVRDVHIDQTQPRSFDLLRMYYMVSFGEQFGYVDQSSALYKDGLDLIQKWFDRTDLNKTKVVSVEVKKTFPLKTSIGEVPFTYIFDRLDLTEDGVYRVVDYKTSRWNVTSEDLRKKIQARVYALALMIEHPELDRVWVQFDMLRWGDPVGVMFTKDENRKTYRYLKAQAERIIKTAREDAPETLNSECKFCIKVTSCAAVASNAAAGGIMGLDLQKQIDRYALLDAQRAAIASALASLETQITAAAKEDSWYEAEGVTARAKFKTSRRRYVDADLVSHMVPPQIWAKYGSHKISLEDFTNMCNDPALSAGDRTRLRGMVSEGFGQPKLKVEMKKGIGDDD